MTLAVICAMSKNRVIGKDNGLPWHLPGDLKHFKQTTLGSPIIMGRKTWESIGRPLPNRINIIVSRSGEIRTDGVKTLSSLADALELAEKSLMNVDSNEIFVIGGAELYKEAFPLAGRLYLTRVDSVIKGDTYLEGFEEADWVEVSRKHFDAANSEGHNYSICVLDRRRNLL
ncbi:MAG: dihydrofolate reductase [Gammaproteobacteria bacterium]|jgi:dihydrofolate reductase|nr:dihydrofolate reductase [Gammaproteobacteria bacterium]